MNFIKPELVILIGIPASGKSSFYDNFFQSTHTRINLDSIKSRWKEKLLFQGYVRKRKSIVIDNTNVTTEDRERYIPYAIQAGYFIKSYYFKPDINECLRRNEKRDVRTRVPSLAIHTLFSRLEPPYLEEGFDQIFTVELLSSGNFKIS